MAQRQVLLPGDLPPNLSGERESTSTAIDHDWPTLEALERRYVDRVLDRTAGNKTAAANILGVDRRTLQRMLKDEDQPQEPADNAEDQKKR
jgi:transcriptional regulator with PAS, ATPase and Fis domain